MNRLTELQTAILSLPGSVEYNKHSEIVGRAGGPVKAWEEVRNLQIKLPDLQKHVTWDRTARAHLKTVEKTMPVTTTVWQLDYGGVNDSAGNKVSVWSATIISAPATGRKQEHFDFFFDQAPSKDKFTNGTAKKDGLTGILMLGEMLDPEKSPKGDGVSLFATHYPENEEILLSGDTGNGYRAYQMLEELSKVFTKYGYRNKLIPLAPGHAWNRTDARIAHMNTMLNIILATSRVFGAIGIAATFRAASDPRLRDQRKFMARSHIFFVVVKVDREEALMQKKLLGSHVFSPRLHGGKMGVRGFLYFDFSVNDDSGRTAHVPGFARVREHADPDMPNNPTYVYTWRKDLASTICQRCSNEWQGPVRLQVHGCTKKKCSIAVEFAAAETKEEDDRTLPGMPLQRKLPPPQEPDAMKKKKQSKTKHKSTATDSRPDARQVRAVHEYGKKAQKKVGCTYPREARTRVRLSAKGGGSIQRKTKTDVTISGPCRMCKERRQRRSKTWQCSKNSRLLGQPQSTQTDRKLQPVFDVSLTGP